METKKRVYKQPQVIIHTIEVQPLMDAFSMPKDDGPGTGTVIIESPRPPFGLNGELGEGEYIHESVSVWE